MSETLFTKIINRDIPAEIIYEDDRIIVIPDKFPSVYGQTLVVTKKPEAYIFDLDAETYKTLTEATKRVALALDRAFNTVRTCVVIEGFEVPHVHVRLYPCTSETLQLDERKEASDETLKKVADTIRQALTV